MFAARDVELDRTVALKRVSAEGVGHRGVPALVGRELVVPVAKFDVSLQIARP